VVSDAVGHARNKLAADAERSTYAERGVVMLSGGGRVRLAAKRMRTATYGHLTVRGWADPRTPEE
jgi:hypothetical protein